MSNIKAYNYSFVFTSLTEVNIFFFHFCEKKEFTKRPDSFCINLIYSYFYCFSSSSLLFINTIDWFVLYLHLCVKMSFNVLPVQLIQILFWVHVWPWNRLTDRESNGETIEKGLNEIIIIYKFACINQMPHF